MSHKLLIKCRNCYHLETYKDPEGLVIRCGKGHYDVLPKSRLRTSLKKTPVYYSVLALKSGNAGMYKAIHKCGPDYQVALLDKRIGV